MGNYYLMGVEIQFRKMKNILEMGSDEVKQNVNVLTTLEMCT
jgi:hypothetical protein